MTSPGSNTNMPSAVKNNRKASKPLMEKRRRARINQSLSELKDLIVCSNKSEMENSRRSKLEKADILEMTVQHLHKIHQRQKHGRESADSGQDDSCEDSNDAAGDNLKKFRAGFHECVLEVTRYLTAECAPFDVHTRSRLTDHLQSCAQRLTADANESFDRSPASPDNRSTPPSPPPQQLTDRQNSPHRRRQNDANPRVHPYHPEASQSPTPLRPDSTTTVGVVPRPPPIRNDDISSAVAPESPSPRVSPPFHPREPEVAMDVPFIYNGPSHPANSHLPPQSSRDADYIRGVARNYAKGIRFAVVDYRAPSGKRQQPTNARLAVKRDLKSVLRLQQHIPAVHGAPVWRPW